MKEIIVLAMLLEAATIRPVQPEATPPSIVSFVIKRSGGNPRIIVHARFNGHPLAMMVHSNASFFAQLKHGQAASFGTRLLPGTHKSYGIDRAGHVSDLGLDRGLTNTLTVGQSVNHDAPTTVFEIPQAHLGMLGIGWIAANRIIVDFPSRKLWISPTTEQAASLAARLNRRGYTALPIAYDTESDRYMVMATINGVSRRMTIATASSFLIDKAFAEAASIPMGRPQGSGGGPSGAQVADYALLRPISVTIGSWNSSPIAKGVIEDQYGYLDKKRPADPTKADGGSLGGDFLEGSAAVVDFGNRILFVKS